MSGTGMPGWAERSTTGGPATAPLLLILDTEANAPAWLAAIRYASQRLAWSAPPECRFLSHCLRPELWPDAAVSATFARLVRQPADGESGTDDTSTEPQRHEEDAVDHAMRLLWGASGGSVYRPAPTDERRLAAFVVPGSSTLDLRLGACRLGRRQTCGFWTGDLRHDRRSGAAIRRPTWMPKFPMEESALRIVDACHAISRTLSDLRHLGLASVNGCYDFWA